MQQVLATKVGDFYQLSVSDNDKQMFLDYYDYKHFLNLMDGLFKADDQIKIVAYCLSRDCINVLYFAEIGSDIETSVRELLTQYEKYCKQKYNTDFHKLLDDYVIDRISDDKLVDASKNIHKSIKKWLDYEHSSARAYLYGDEQIELFKDPITRRFTTTSDYYEYLLN